MMVWHDHKRTHLNTWKPMGQRLPHPVRHFPSLIQTHLCADHLAKQARPALDDHRHEIRARLCVVVSPQSDGPAVMVVRVVAVFQWGVLLEWHTSPPAGDMRVLVGATLVVALLGVGRAPTRGATGGVCGRDLVCRNRIPPHRTILDPGPIPVRSHRPM